MALGPFYRQIGGDFRIFRQWTMFSAAGVGMIDARFTHVLEDGTEIVLNRLSLLKPDSREGNPQQRWVITDPDGEISVAHRLCEQLNIGRIKIESRVAQRTGWVPVAEGRIVECGGQQIVVDGGAK
jgi:hypothetical protein